MAELVVSHRSEWGEWETFQRAPSLALRPYIRRYVGWVERTTRSRRREVPHDSPVLIVNLFGDLRVSQPGDPTSLAPYRGFFAGLTDSYVVTETDGRGGGIQVDLTALGGRLFLGRPMSEVSHAVLELADLLGAEGEDIVERLHSARTWDARFEAMDAFLEERIGRAAPVSEPIAWAWHTLTASHGATRVGALAETIGWSQRHFIGRFREDVGLAPKQYARILRFQDAVQRLQGPEPPRFADLAADCGYYDQPHFAREFRHFAGCTPTEFRAELLPDQARIVDSATR